VTLKHELSHIYREEERIVAELELLGSGALWPGSGYLIGLR